MSHHALAEFCRASKPSLWLAIFTLGALAGVLVADGAWPQGRPTDQQRQIGPEFRWASLMFQIPDDSGVSLLRDLPTREHTSGRTILLYRGNSRLILDAENGEVLADAVKAEDKAIFNAIVATVIVDSSPPAPMAWPYQGDPSAVERRSEGGLSYLPPDPASGIVINEGIGYGSGYFLSVTNGRSNMFVDGLTGLVVEASARVASQDKHAFHEFYSTVRLTHGDGTTLGGKLSSKPGAWPYTGQPADTVRRQWGRITYIAPDPASGLAVVVTGINERPTGGVNTLQLTNGRSHMTINADTGVVFEADTYVAPFDQLAFDNFHSHIEAP